MTLKIEKAAALDFESHIMRILTSPIIEPLTVRMTLQVRIRAKGENKNSNLRRDHCSSAQPDSKPCASFSFPVLSTMYLLCT